MTFTQYRLVKYTDLNPSQHLFAGTSATWFVEESYLCAATQYPQCKLVCRTIKNMEMILPVNVGDVLIYSGSCSFGRTSITVSMIVSRQSDAQIVAKGEVVFVNINGDGKPTPHNIESK